MMKFDKDFNYKSKRNFIISFGGVIIIRSLIINLIYNKSAYKEMSSYEKLNYEILGSSLYFFYKSFLESRFRSNRNKDLG